MARPYLGAIYLVYSLSHESTDDAYVTGMIVPVAPEIRGRVVNVYVTDNQYVKAGSRLLDIFPQDYADAVKERGQAVSTLTAEKVELQASLKQRQKALAQAQANLAAAGAEETLAEKEFEAVRPPGKRGGGTSRASTITSNRAWKVAHARKEAAASAVDEARGGDRGGKGQARHAGLQDQGGAGGAQARRAEPREDDPRRADLGKDRKEERRSGKVRAARAGPPRHRAAGYLDRRQFQGDAGRKDGRGPAGRGEG